MTRGLARFIGIVSIFTVLIFSFNNCSQDGDTSAQSSSPPLDGSFGGDIDILRQPSSISVNEGDDAILSILVSAPEDVEFQWYKDGQKLFGEESDSLNLQAATLSDSGEYKVLVSSLVEEGIGVFSKPALVTVESGTPGGAPVLKEGACPQTDVSNIVNAGPGEKFELPAANDGTLETIRNRPDSGCPSDYADIVFQCIQGTWQRITVYCRR